MLLSKTELKYLNHGKIYKIICNVTGMVYYGSTIKSLKQRLTKHKSDYKQYLNGNYRYTTSFKIIENGDYNIYLVEDYRCLNKKQLESIERVYIENYKCINKCVVGRTNKEYYQDNKDKIKEYYENNKHKINEYKKDYYQKNKDKLKEYQKEYRANNKHKIKEYNKEYRENNKHKARHMKSIKHQKYLLRKEYLLPNFKSCSL